jgi:hypothetical protein
MGNNFGKNKYEQELDIMIKELLTRRDGKIPNLKYQPNGNLPNNNIQKSNINALLNSKKVFDLSTLLANELINKKDYSKRFNTDIYKTVFVFYNIAGDQVNMEDTTDYQPEKEELSNYSQVSCAKKLFFRKKSKKSISTDKDEYFNILKTNESKPKIDIEESANLNIKKTNSFSSTQMVNLEEANKRSMIANSLNINNISSNQRNQSQSIIPYMSSYKEKSFEDISLQEYLNMETERLKKDRINNPTPKVPLINPLLEISSNNDFDSNYEYKSGSSFNLKKNVNIIQNKHMQGGLVNFSMSARNSVNIKKNKNLQIKKSVEKTQSLNSTGNNFKQQHLRNSIKLTKTQKPKLLSPDRSANISTIPTSRPPSSNRMKTSKTIQQHKKTNLTSTGSIPRVDLSQKSAYSIVYYNKKDEDISSSHLITKKPPLASIRIDLRELLKDESPHEGLVDLHNLDSNLHLDTLTNDFERNNKEDQSNDIDKFIIKKQKFDKNGNLII